MKKTAVLLLTGALLTGAVAGLAAGDESVISKAYLTGTFTQQVLKQTQKRVEDLTQPVYQTVLTQLEQQHQTVLGQTTARGGGGFADQRYKKGDKLLVSTGAGAMLLAGSVQCSYTGTAVIDTATGQILPAGQNLTAYHRVLAGENTTMELTILSDTAVVSLEGPYTTTLSSAVDYNAMADCLHEMGLFQGTDIAYGSGYHLERQPTRLEALVMFIRLLGEEQAALQSTAPNPFLDTPEWADRYVAYAYQQGYTKGTGGTPAAGLYFSPNTKIQARNYMTFLLRALGYSDSGDAPDFSWETAVTDSVSIGVLRPSEQALMEQGTFYRAQLVYLSCCGLGADRKDGSSQLSYTAFHSGGDYQKMEVSLAKATILRVQ